MTGTALHVFVGTFAIVLCFAPASPLVPALPDAAARRLLAGALFVGSAVLVALSPLGRRSGGHLNPAISIAFRIRGKLSGVDLAGYIAAQCLGALSGAWSAAELSRNLVRSVGYAVTQPGHDVSSVEVIVIEAAAAAVVVTVLLSLMASMRTARFTLPAVWLCICLYVWQLAPVTGASVNSARSLGPALVAHRLSGTWPYLVGPNAGAAIAALMWTAIGMPGTISHSLFPHRGLRGSAHRHQR